MTREQHLDFCKICNNRAFNPNKGIICKLTNKIADFESTCETFEKDEAEEQVVFQKKMAFAGDTDSGDSIDFKKNKQNGQIAFVIGAGVLIFTLMADSIPLIIIPFGAIGWGVSVYFKGVEQEKLWLKNKNSTNPKSAEK